MVTIPRGGGDEAARRIDAFSAGWTPRTLDLQICPPPPAGGTIIRLMFPPSFVPRVFSLERGGLQYWVQLDPRGGVHYSGGDNLLYTMLGGMNSLDFRAVFFGASAMRAYSDPVVFSNDDFFPAVFNYYFNFYLLFLIVLFCMALGGSAPPKGVPLGARHPLCPRSLAPTLRKSLRCSTRCGRAPRGVWLGGWECARRCACLSEWACSCV